MSLAASLFSTLPLDLVTVSFCKEGNQGRDHYLVAQDHMTSMFQSQDCEPGKSGSKVCIPFGHVIIVPWTKIFNEETTVRPCFLPCLMWPKIQLFM